MSIAANDANLYFSPGNWNVNGTRAKTINAGAYLRALIAGGTTIALTFDLTGVSTPLPKIGVRVDGGDWQVSNVAASVPVAIANTAWPSHELEVMVIATNEVTGRWAGTTTAVNFTGITTTGTSLPVRTRALKGLVFGDSITEGMRTVAAAGNLNDHDARLGFAYNLGVNLGAEIGVIGFGGTTYGGAHTGNGGVPAMAQTYDELWGGGPARSFAGLDFVVLAAGRNDHTASTSGEIITGLSTVLNGIIASAAPTTKIYVLRPFYDAVSTAPLLSGIAASSQPARPKFIDSAGWWSTSDSPDTIHPYGYAHLQLSRRLAAAMRPTLLSGGVKVWNGSVWS